MKNKFLMAMCIVALLALVLPGAAFGKGPAEIKVWIRNVTGGEVAMSLTGSDGNIMYLTLVNDMTQVTIKEGNYDFYAQTRCGATAGTWNLEPGGKYILRCIDDQVAVERPGQCGEHGWYVYDGGYYFLSWENWGEPTWNNRYHFLYDVTGDHYDWAYYSCWQEDHKKWFYGW